MSLTVFPVVEKQQCIVLMWGKENKWPCRSSALWHRCENKMCKFWGMVFSHNPLQFLILYSSSPCPSNCSPLCQPGDELQGSACLGSWGVRRAAQQPWRAPLGFICPMHPQMLDLMRAQITIFLPRVDSVTWNLLSRYSEEGKRAGTGMHRIVTGIPVNGIVWRTANNWIWQWTESKTWALI